MSSAVSVIDGRKTVTTAGTREQLVATNVSGVHSVCIQALSTNTGAVVVGGATVIASAGTRRGVYLTAGQSVSVDCDDLADVYIDVATNGEGVTYVATVAS